MKTQSIVPAVLAVATLVTGCATLEEGIAEETAETYYATLTGAQVVGGGDPDGAARVEITVSDELGQICWDLDNIANIDTITAAHIHRGVKGTNGPPVFTLRRANEGGFKGCTDIAEWTQYRIEKDPYNFYVNVHTIQYPGGAIRGQLG